MVKSKQTTYFTITVVLVLLVCLAYDRIARSLGHGDWPLLGNFGAMFGALAALFSGLAFAAIYFTLRLQKEQLDIQMRALDETQRQVEEQKQAFGEQQFESKFFELLRTYTTLVNSMHAKSGVIEWRGIHWFDMPQNAPLGIFAEVTSSRTDLHRQIDEAYSQLRNQYGPVLGHYFQNLDILIRFTDQSTVRNKKFFIDIINAQLSTSQKYLLFYHCFSTTGPSMKDVVLRNGLLAGLESLLPRAHVALLTET